MLHKVQSEAEQLGEKEGLFTFKFYPLYTYFYCID